MTTVLQRLVVFVSLFLMSANAQANSPASAKTALFDFTYRVEIPKPATPFSHLAVWIPLASDQKDQQILKTRISSPVPYQTTTEDKFGNKMIFIDIRPTTPLPLQIEATYRVRRTSSHAIALREVVQQPGWDPKQLVGIDRKIPLNDKIAKLAQKSVQDATSEWDKIDRIFRFVTNYMTYNKDGTGWGQGDAVWACDNKRGNCTDFHSLLMGMARSQNIPARFEIGFPIPSSSEGDIPGYHCWVWVFSQSKGWVPLDSSEAKKSGKIAEYLGRLPADRVQFSNGRDIALNPKQHGELLNYFIYPYVEIDGQSSKAYKTAFHFKRVKRD